MKPAGRHRAPRAPHHFRPRVVPVETGGFGKHSMTKTVTHEQCSRLAMVAGGELRHPTIIEGNLVFEWVGFGWIPLREATPEDRDTLPILIESTSPPRQKQLA